MAYNHVKIIFLKTEGASRQKILKYNKRSCDKEAVLRLWDKILRLAHSLANHVTDGITVTTGSGDLISKGMLSKKLFKWRDSCAI